MKTNEIRVGNYFLDRGDKVLRLDFWECPGMVAMNNVVGGMALHPFTEHISKCKGIPLTEKWLLDFGFEMIKKSPFKNHKMPYWVNNGIVLFFNGSPPENIYLACVADFVSDFNGGGDYIAIGNQWIDSVHTLQNFYQSNKGKELTVKA